LRLALPVSAALHAAVLYAAARIDWAAPDVEPSAPVAVVWITEWPRPAEPLYPEPPLVEPQIDPQVIEPPPEPEPQPEPESVEATAEPPPAQTDPDAPAEEEPQPAAAPEPPRLRVPNVDWETERQRAAVSVLERQTREEAYRSFSTDDLPERKTAGDGSPPTPLAEVMEDGCAIVKGKLQRMAMMMIGRCVRESRGDLFVDAKPSYLTKRPLCVDTRDPQVAAAESASGREYSTIKCRLVDADEE
jgi:hypothetical protein